MKLKREEIINKLRGKTDKKTLDKMLGWKTEYLEKILKLWESLKNIS